jgi:hypothetical protein
MSDHVIKDMQTHNLPHYIKAYFGTPLVCKRLGKERFLFYGPLRTETVRAPNYWVAQDDLRVRVSNAIGTSDRRTVAHKRKAKSTWTL